MTAFAATPHVFPSKPRLSGIYTLLLQRRDVGEYGISREIRAITHYPDVGNLKAHGRHHAVFTTNVEKQNAYLFVKFVANSESLPGYIPLLPLNASSNWQRLLCYENTLPKLLEFLSLPQPQDAEHR